jgi:ribosomal protein S18 acetylase RimI-like enzyme
VTGAADAGDADAGDAADSTDSAASGGPKPHNGTVEIRRARVSDADAVAFVHVRSWQAAYRGLLPDELLDGLSVARRAAMWRSIVENDRPGDSVLVLEDADENPGEHRPGALAGFAHVCAARDDDVAAGTGEVSAIYLLPTTWGRGWGRALMEACAQELRGHGYTEAVLWVLDTNARARHFYEAAGWTGDGSEKSERIGGDGSRGATITETRYRRAL